jgi:N-acetylglucosaminyldiphosphoundecaprenol N-acetyl-beta-D-mannosaminyltransferase
MKSQPKTDLFGIRISPLRLTILLGEIEKAIAEKRRLLVGNVNIYAGNLAWEQHSFRDALNKFDIIFCDGYGVKLGSAVLGKKIPERFTPPDFVGDLAEILIKNGGSLFLLGSKKGIAEKAAKKLIIQYPTLIISGVHHGYFNKEPGNSENDAVLSEINQANPTLLLVGFGMPIQEKWLVDNWRKLNVPIALTVGALFDTLSGEIPRAPKFLTDHGFEWLTRLIIEPHRLWRRYLIGNPIFMWRILKQKLGILKPYK